MYILYIIVLKIKLITNLHALSVAIHVLSNYSDLLGKIRAHTYKEIIEFVSNALFTDNVNPIAFKMTGEFRCVSFLVNNCIQYFRCAFDVPFCIR